MPVIENDIRHQITFGTLDEMISQDSAARVVDALLNTADLDGLGFEFKGESKVGRPAYLVSRMAKLYVFGYLNRIRSSHQLAKACQTNMEVRWLINGNRPCQKTVSDFRSDNTEAIGKLLVWFNGLLASYGLFETDVYAIDSAIISAQNSRQNNYSEKRIEQRLEEIEKEVSNYLLQLNNNDERYQDLLKRQAKYEKLRAQLKKSPDRQISTVDPDSRLLTKGGRAQVGFSVQSAVDGENKLIACIQVTNCGDSNALYDMAKKAKEVTGHGAIRVLADKAYDTGLQINKCASEGIETYVSPKAPRKKANPNQITKEDFHFHPMHNCYVCPAGNQLTTNGKTHTMTSKRPGRKPYNFQIYELPFSKCQGCPNLQNCLPEKAIEKKRNRTIQRSQYEDQKDANVERVTEFPEIYKKRKSIVEHPFGTIKRGWGYYYTLLKGLEKVQAEYELIAMAYNLRRTMSIFGNLGFLERIKAFFVIKFWLLDISGPYLPVNAD